MANMGKQYVTSRSVPNFGMKKSQKELRKFPQPGHNDTAPSATTDLSDYRQPQPGEMIANVMKSQSTSKSSSTPNYMVGKQLQAPRRNKEMAIPNAPTQLKATPRTSNPMAGVVQPKMMIGRADDEYGQGVESIATPEVQLKAERVGRTHQEPAQLQQHPDTATQSTLGGDRSLQGKGERTGKRYVIKEESRPNETGLPERLKTGIENLSGYSMDEVRVHYNSEKPAELQAHAYAQGKDIHIARGAEKYLPHEAWHVVQQKEKNISGTHNVKGNVKVNDNAVLERAADVMGEKALGLGKKSVSAGLSWSKNQGRGATSECKEGRTVQLVGKQPYPKKTIPKMTQEIIEHMKSLDHGYTRKYQNEGPTIKFASNFINYDSWQEFIK